VTLADCRDREENMRERLVFLACFIAPFLIFGCSIRSDTAEVSSVRYFEQKKKDELLYAARKIFQTKEPYVYMVDSYRDRVEVSYITTFFNDIQHKDYTFNVEEDDCGVLAKLRIKTSKGVEKSDEQNLSLSEHNYFWEQITPLLDIIDQNQTDESNLSKRCDIKSEFEQGIIRDEINTTDVLDESI